MILGRSKLHTCLPKYLDQTKGTQMAEADKGVSYCFVLPFFFFPTRYCFAFVCERGARREEGDYVNMFVLISFYSVGKKLYKFNIRACLCSVGCQGLELSPPFRFL